ncbi:MAG: V-type ATP synthase subunit C [Anaerococcus prevotii]|uniref:V-type ATP synthase subunit C n=2 Tax=Peptoniphilaceae TaxID=1570339 RepID=UPI002902368F|nr:V-type ATP synthase subunit C [Anaerococcus prevotii]MDU2557699.1 V-type ATP synthase subunit C [Anaerococcus prevotii]MDU2584280.1 V-type ATP synthase subunit C [Anaerococcus prevotii]
MNKDDYISASISTRMYEKNLLTRTDLERLNDYDSLREVLNQLNETIYRGPINDLDRPEEYEKILKDELKRVYKAIEDIAPDKEIIDYMKEKYIFHNLKVLVKELIQDKDYSSLYLEMGDIDLAYIKKNLIKEDRKSDFFDKVASLSSDKEDDLVKDSRDLYLDYAQKALSTYEETKNPQDIDISLDKSYYEKLLLDAKALDLDTLIDFTRETIDLINLKSLLRVKSQGEDMETLEKTLIEGGFIEPIKFKEYFSYEINQLIGSLSNAKVGGYVKDSLKDDLDLDDNILALEKAIDSHMTDYTRDSKMITFGPEVLMNYVISKETEIKNLRILLVSKLNKLDKEFTLEKLRKSYV